MGCVLLIFLSRFFRTLALSVSGYQWADLAACVDWMSPFHQVLREELQTATPNALVHQQASKTFPAISPENQHNIQIHNIELRLMESGQERLAEAQRRSPLPSSAMAISEDVVMTPPDEEGDVQFPAPAVSRHRHNNSPTAAAAAAEPPASVFYSPDTSR